MGIRREGFSVDWLILSSATTAEMKLRAPDKLIVYIAIMRLLQGHSMQQCEKHKVVVDVSILPSAKTFP